VNRQAGELAVNHRADESLLNHPRNLENQKPRKRSPKAELLKRLARRAMGDVTDCPPETIGAHVARLQDLSAIIAYELHHDFKETPEAIVGLTPHCPYTLAEFLHCLEFTRKQHRAPAFVNQRDADIADIKQMISTLAGLVAQNPEALELLQRQFEKSQTEEAA
jgi:hypothetical protein